MQYMKTLFCNVKSAGSPLLKHFMDILTGIPVSFLCNHSLFDSTMLSNEQDCWVCVLRPAQMFLKCLNRGYSALLPLPDRFSNAAPTRTSRMYCLPARYETFSPNCCSRSLTTPRFTPLLLDLSSGSSIHPRGCHLH